MAKIKSVSLKSIPDIIQVGDDVSDITVIVQIEFHPLDVKLEMEYLLHLFVYDVHDTVDTPVILGNWDESNVFGIADRWKDELLGREMATIKAVDGAILKIDIPMALHIGKLSKTSSHYSRKLEVFSTIIPAIGRASKWSEPFETYLTY